MRVVVVLEHRYDRTPDGAVWTTVGFGRPFWSRYREVFDGVRVVARLRDVPEPPADGQRVDGDGVEFAPVPYYVGPWQYLRRMWSVRNAVREAVGPQDAVILRVSSQLANGLEPALRSAGRPYAVEVVGDPWDVFSPGSVRSILRPVFRHWFAHRLRRQCRGAFAAAYVTESALQRRYPCPGRCIAVSDVELPDEPPPPPRRAETRTGPLRLIMVGTLAQMYKAPDVLLAAVAKCVSGGLNLHLSLVGDGAFRPEMERLADRLGLAGRVAFLGRLPAGQAVRRELDRADLFVMPSRQEGLPRAAVEAMARGLPVVASDVGGFPELLPPEDMVPAGDADALASKLREVASDPGRRERMSVRSLQTAARYGEGRLAEIRRGFYQLVRDGTKAGPAAR